MKLKRGQKRCKNCRTINAARQRVCVHCNKEFVLKNTPVKNEVTDWKSLQKGDLVRVINGTGPFFQLSRNCGEGLKGDKLFLGCRGKYIVRSVEDDGVDVLSITKNARYEYLYMGPTEFCDNSGIHRRPYRIVRINPRKRAKR